MEDPTANTTTSAQTLKIEYSAELEQELRTMHKIDIETALIDAIAPLKDDLGVTSVEFRKITTRSI